jgi:hypothetical protein
MGSASAADDRLSTPRPFSMAPCARRLVTRPQVLGGRPAAHAGRHPIPLVDKTLSGVSIQLAGRPVTAVAMLDSRLAPPVHAWPLPVSRLATPQTRAWRCPPPGRRHAQRHTPVPAPCHRAHRNGLPAAVRRRGRRCRGQPGRDATCPTPRRPRPRLLATGDRCQSQPWRRNISASTAPMTIIDATIAGSPHGDSRPGIPTTFMP